MIMTSHRFAFVVVAVFVSKAAIAQEVAAGWEGDDRRGYVFASPNLSFDIGAAQALVLRSAGSFLYYDFPTDGGRVEVTSPGVGAAVGYRIRGHHANATITAGYEVRQTRRAQPGATTQTMERGPTGAAEVFVSAGPLTRISALASYGHANRYGWTRSSVTRQLTNRRFAKSRALGAGVDVTLAGNRDITTQQVGGVVVWDWFRVNASLQLRAGYSRSLSSGVVIDRHPYVGVGVYHRF
jgi:Cellulose biosynthesis protein BcsS